MLDNVLQSQDTQRTGFHKRLRRRRYLSATALCLAAALLLLFVCAGVLANQVQAARDSIVLRNDLATRSRQLQMVLSLLQDAETGQRGYLLTGRPRYLVPYEEAKGELWRIVAAVSASSSGDPEIEPHVAQIERLAHLKFAELDETIRLTTLGNRAGALTLVQTDQGQRYMEDLRLELGLAMKSLSKQGAAADVHGLADMVSVKRLAWWTAAALTTVVLLAALQLRSLVRLRTNYEKQLATQASMLNTIVDEIPSSVAIWDLELRYRLVNKAFERWRGRARESVIGRTIADVTGPEEFALSKPWIERALNGENVTYEKQYDSGAVRRVSASYSPLVAEDGGVIGIVAMAHDITTHHRERERLQQLSERDSLTGLLNRQAFEAWIADACLEHSGRDLAVLYVDLDHFKPVNDQFGHAVGDLALGEFARRLCSVVRPTDAVARLGGDEFAIALPGVRSMADAEMIAQKVVAEGGRPMKIDMHEIRIGASVGVAVDASREREGWKGLIARADEMLYRAKRSGRNKVCSASN